MAYKRVYSLPYNAISLVIIDKYNSDTFMTLLIFSSQLTTRNILVSANETDLLNLTTIVTLPVPTKEKVEIGSGTSIRMHELYWESL